MIACNGIVQPSGKAMDGLLMTASGRVVPVEVVCKPLSNSSRANEIYAIRDATDRHRTADELRRQNEILQDREEELRTQNHRLEVTLTNMAHGLCMIDPERRIVVCNKRYIEMYDLPPRFAEPGTPLDEIFAYRIGKGLYAAAEDEEYKSKSFKAAIEPSVKIRHLSDGRTVLITRQPTGDGGWIALHDDITEQQQLNARLEEQNQLLLQREAELRTQNTSLDLALAKLDEQKTDLDLALSNMSQGLAMFDGQERLVLANDRYAKIYGLEPGHLQPGTTLRELIEYRIDNGLYPGMIADDVLQNMRQRVARNHASQLISQPGGGRTLSVSI